MDVGAVILAGGKSSRMGQNKALLPIDGISNIERIKISLSEAFSEIMLVANDETIYEFLHVPIVRDLFLDKGPLAGIQAGLLAAKYETNLFVACDMPFISSELGRQLAAESTGYDAVVPIINGVRHPLFAVYKKTVLPILEKCLHQNELRIKNLLDQVNVKYITEAELQNMEIDILTQVFYNMNHPSEYEEAKKMAKK